MLPIISAEIIADSISASGTRITTFELVYPRIIHAELMTHRVFSRNAASSRAIPIETINKMIKKGAARPAHWGKNQSGMQAFEECSEKIRRIVDESGKVVAEGYTADEWWDLAAASAVGFSQQMADAGYHKQVCNRLTEPFQYMKVIVTATSYDNWFNLRNHVMADPTIHMLAVTMLESYKESTPRLLSNGEWHTPYYGSGFWTPFGETDKDVHGVTLADALSISASCCAQVSYRKLDDSLEKAQSIVGKLIPGNDEPAHASPFEHQATPLKVPVYTVEMYKDLSNTDGLYTWEDAVTHMDKFGNFWSANFKHWAQHRQLIPNHDCTDYKFPE